MEALRMAAAPQALCSFESSSLGVRRSSLSGLASDSPSGAVPVGLVGDGLSSVRRSACRLSFSASPASASSPGSSSPRPRLRRKLSGLASPPRSTAAAVAAIQGLELEGESSLLKDIESQDLEAETPSLLLQCSDLDWKKLVDDLRSEALHGLQSSGLRALSLKALEKLMETWIHEAMVSGIERPPGAKTIHAAANGWSAEAAASELRMEANLQAAQMLAKGVDSSFDWETDVAELHQRILLQGGAEPSLLRPEQRLWKVWACAQDHMVQTSDKLTDEALESTSVNGQAASLNSTSQEEVVGSTAEPSSTKSRDGKSLLSLGAAVATGLAVEGMWLMDAIADEASPEAIEAAARAPSWLIPAVLIFPPLSYFIFNVYRDKVNPYAKVTDWMFGVVAVTIVSNIVMMAVWGVRLY